jgi:hypothetical protein
MLYSSSRRSLSSICVSVTGSKAKCKLLFLGKSVILYRASIKFKSTKEYLGIMITKKGEERGRGGRGRKAQLSHYTSYAFI